MNKEQQFSKVFEAHGRSLPHAKMSKNEFERIRQHRDWYNGIDPNTYVGIVDNSAFNAVACKHRLGEFVAIYIGAISQLTLYAHQLLAHPDCFPEIGNVSLENPDPEVMRLLTVGDLDEVVLRHFHPVCPVRANAADRIAECACLALCLHELAHIEGCHLDLIFEELRISEYQEISSLPLTEEESLLLRALELEADSVALMNCLSIWRVMSDQNNHEEIAAVGATGSWRIATDLLFWVMSLNHDRARPRLLSSHPLVITRYANARTLRGWDGLEDKELISTIEDSRYSLIPWFKKHAESSCIFDTSSYTREKAFSETSELHDFKETLWSRLEPLQEKRAQRLLGIKTL